MKGSNGWPMKRWTLPSPRRFAFTDPYYTGVCTTGVHITEVPVLRKCPFYRGNNNNNSSISITLCPYNRGVCITDVSVLQP